ncbi:MAG TPA: low specificity L-threonine aldolase [Cyclobacteriaceae bacterium]|nr:low specificity L-threonine aldolase [Cyclobacteriaceae bacterium]
MKAFASDNYSGVHPEIMQALQKANIDHAGSYGNDNYTSKAVSKFKEHFGDDIEVFFIYNGTAANVLGLSTLTQSFNSVLCAEGAHINVDESTAPEKFLGCKLVTIPSPDGKITAAQVKEKIQRIGDQHHPQAKVISISQASEYATVYTVDEVRALGAVARENNMYLHMDGSRIANASVTLGKTFREFTRDAGVDVLSFGGTKNGLMFGEAIVFFKPELAANFMYIRKQGMQLASKMRFIATQFEALLTGDLWKRNAMHTNKLARLLSEQLSSLGLKVTQKVEANGVFAIFPAEIIEPLQKEYPFYVWVEKTNEVRLMCSWDSTEEEITSFINKVRSLLLHSVSAKLVS